MTNQKEIKLSSLKLSLLNWKTKSAKSTKPLSSFTEVKRAVIFLGLHLWQRNQKEILDFKAYLKDLGIDSTLIFLYPTKDPKTVAEGTPTNEIHLILKDFSGYGYPKSEKAQKAANLPSELFINLNSEPGFHELALGRLSKAYFKITPYQSIYKNDYTVLLKSNPGNLTEYLRQIREFFSHLT
ncbi:MAG: hypothetical protein NBV77_06230 [Bacteroidia bacterium]|nr:hypothetical protein [Bacteroidia bacterium]